MSQEKKDYHRRNIKNASNLKYFHEELNPDSKFFNKDTLDFFGDSMSNYGVRFNKDFDLFQLYRKKVVKNRLKTSTFFCPVTLKRVFRRNLDRI